MKLNMYMGTEHLIADKTCKLLAYSFNIRRYNAKG